MPLYLGIDLGTSGCRAAVVDEDVVLHSSIPTGTPDEMLESIARARELGYRIHSCKVGSGVEDDIRRIAVISEALADAEEATWDVNRAWLCS